jgi:hypothetical protein
VLLGLSLARLGKIIPQEALNFLGKANLSLGAHPLGEVLHLGDFFPLLTHPILGVSSLGLTLGIIFVEGPNLHPGAYLVLVSVMLL